MNNTTNASMTFFSVTFGSSYHLLLLALATLIVIANVSVLYVFMKTQGLRVGTTNRLLANLAVSDLLTGLVTIPMTIASATLTARSDINVFIIYFISNVLSDFGTIYSVSSLCLVIYDRYVLVCEPFTRERQNTRVPSCWQIALSWISMLLLAALPFLWSYDLLFDPLAMTKEHHLTAEKVYVVFITVLFFFIPSCFVCIALFLMLLEVKKLATDISCSNQKRTNRTQVAVVVKFLVAFITFLFCWVPLMTIRILDYFLENISKNLTAESLEAMFAMRCVTSLINPLIYTWNDRDYKKAISNSYLYKRLAGFVERRTNVPNQERCCMV